MRQMVEIKCTAVITCGDEGYSFEIPQQPDMPVINETPIFWSMFLKTHDYREFLSKIHMALDGYLRANHGLLLNNMLLSSAITNEFVRDFPDDAFPRYEHTLYLYTGCRHDPVPTP